jgi:hypothetical protein
MVEASNEPFQFPNITVTLKSKVTIIEDSPKNNLFVMGEMS